MTAQSHNTRFIIAGASKSGSEWLLACLREHPEVFAQQNSIDFFSRYYDRGTDWYDQHFDQTGAAKAVGEKSTSYIIFPHCPERIHAWDPSVKLLFCLRDPVARAYSHYCMLLRAGEVGDDVQAVLQPGHMLVEEGRYFDNLQRFYQLFPREQVRVWLHDELLADDAKFVREVLGFLGVDASFEPSLLGKKLHVRKSRPRFIGLFKFTKRVAGWVAHRGKVGERFIRWLRVNGSVDLFHRLNRGEKFPEFTKAHQRQLAEYYREDIIKLAEDIGKDCSPWLAKYGLEAAPQQQEPVEA